jgi:serine O-acetyltransferase
MTFDAKMTKVEDFSLLSYLAADLRRSRVVLHGTSDGVSGLRLWLGAVSPRFFPVLLCRLAHGLYRLKLGPLAKVVSMLNFFLFGIEIAVRCPIGKGLFLPHTQGTVIGAWSIGENVTIFQGVTLGAKEVDFSYLESSRPTVEDGVTIGSGAKVLGGLTLGSGSRVGANSVVLRDVAPGLLVVGIPAKSVDRKPSDHAA